MKLTFLCGMWKVSPGSTNRFRKIARQQRRKKIPGA